MPFDPEKLAKLVKGGAAAAATKVGGTRRKVKQPRKNAQVDDKKLKVTLNKLGVRDIAGVEEVNMHKADGSILHFKYPKVQANVQANTFVVNGAGETKTAQEMMPQMLRELGVKDANDFAKLQQLLQANPELLKEASKLAAQQTGVDEDDVPDLVENFEEISKSIVPPS